MKLLSLLIMGVFTAAFAQDAAPLPPEAARIINAYKELESMEEKAAKTLLQGKLNEALAFLKQIQDREVQRGNLQVALSVEQASVKLKSGNAEIVSDGTYKTVTTAKGLAAYLEQTSWKGQLNDKEDVSFKCTTGGQGEVQPWNHGLKFTADTKRRFTITHGAGSWRIVCFMNADGLGFVGMRTNDDSPIEMKLTAKGTLAR